MNLPNGVRAIVDLRKLRLYCLNSDHPRGRHKARAFESILGFVATDADRLRNLLLNAALSEPAVVGRADTYGQRYTVDFNVRTGTGGAMVRSAWIVRTGENFPRLTSCYVLVGAGADE